MKLDTRGQGLGSIFRPYQIKAIHILLGKDIELNSGEVWKKILETGIEISRASVIFFLNDLVVEGLVTFREETGKGGYHKIYKILANDRAELGEIIIDRFLYKLWEIFPENEKLGELIKS